MAKKKIIDIAAAAQVSPATVSRVFNRHPYVKDKVKKRVLEVARKLKYAPKFSATKNNIGIVVSGDEGISLGPYESLLITAFAQIMFTRNYTFEIIPHTSVPLLHNSSLKGLIVMSSKAAKSLSGLDSPMLTVNHEQDNIPSVSANHREGMRMAVNYLYAAGHRKIAYMGETPPVLSWGLRERLTGYSEGLDANNLPFEQHFLKKEEETLIEAAARISRRGCTAAIVGGEGAVLQFCYGMYLMDKSIPNDISAISFETANFSQYLTPPQTTINQCLKQLALVALNRLEKIITNTDKAPLWLQLDNSLIERESVKKISTS